MTSDDFFNPVEVVRTQAAQIFGGSTAAQDIALIPAASYGVATAVKNLGPSLRAPEGKAPRRIVLLDMQFPSNVYGWRTAAAECGAEVVTAGGSLSLFDPDVDGGSLTRAVLDEIDDRTAVVALPHIRWSDGALLDLVAISDATRAVGASLVLDLTQSLGVLPFDIDAVRPDFAFVAAYKWLLGPYQSGFMYVAPDWQERGRPLEETWIGRQGSRNFAGLVDYTDEYSEGAARFSSGGHSNIHALPMLEASLKQMITWGADRIARRLASYNDKTAQLLSDEFGLAAMPRELCAGHYLTLQLVGSDESERRATAARLAAGLMERNVWVSLRGANVRLTPHVYCDDDDLQRLAAALKELL